MQLEGKAALVTGGAQGIGRAICLRFAREGAAVAVLDVRGEQAAGVAGEIERAGGRSIALAEDITSEAGMEQATRAVQDAFGAIDVLVNNAALFFDYDREDASVAYLRKVFEVNVFGTVVATRAVFPYMKAQRRGSIVNMASTAGYPAWSTADVKPDFEVVPLSGYALSKAGVLFLTKAFARQVGAFQVRVNAIAPGGTATEATRRMFGEENLTRVLGRNTAIPGHLEPEMLTGTAVFLASDDSARMTGQTLVVDSGNVMLG